MDNGRRVRRRLGDAAVAFASNSRNRNLRRAQLGFFGVWMAECAFTVALGIYAYRDGGVAAVGLVGLLRMVPSALCAPLLTPIADRGRRERVLVLVSTLRAVATAAAEPLSCLVLGAQEPQKFAPRGQPAAVQSMGPGADVSAVKDSTATACIDVTEFVTAKVDALCAYRSQFCLERGMLPDSLMRELYGQEYFVQVLPERRPDPELWVPDWS